MRHKVSALARPLFEIKDVDRRIYEDELSDFLPDQMIDIHTHVWLKEFKSEQKEKVRRAVTWPALVAADNSIEDMLETYRLLFPGKKVTPLIFSSLKRSDNHEALNQYIADSSRKFKVPSLLYSFPEWSAEELSRRIAQGRHLGTKVYLNLAPAYLPEKEIRIFDFVPHEQLAFLNSKKMILMLHIPRDGRLGDPVNLNQMLEIEARYPDLNVIYAHIGRAYCLEDFGNAFDVLKETKKLRFDFSATTQDEAMFQATKCVGTERMLFGSDLPILRMRMRRVCEGGRYINIIPQGMYGDVSGDRNMREVSGDEAAGLSLFMYEELRAFKSAAARLGLSAPDIRKIFYDNSKNLINETSYGLYQEDYF